MKSGSESKTRLTNPKDKALNDLLKKAKRLKVNSPEFKEELDKGLEQIINTASVPLEDLYNSDVDLKEFLDEFKKVSD